MAFILPALKPKERKWVVPTVAALVALFFIGMIFCYYVIQPAAFGWLLDQSFEFAQNMADAEDYLNIYMLLEIGFGIAFELPLVIFYLSSTCTSCRTRPSARSGATSTLASWSSRPLSRPTPRP